MADERVGSSILICLVDPACLPIIAIVSRQSCLAIRLIHPARFKELIWNEIRQLSPEVGTDDLLCNAWNVRIPKTPNSPVPVDELLVPL